MLIKRMLGTKESILLSSFILIIIGNHFFGCKLVGIHKLKEVDYIAIESISKQFNLESQHSIIIDTTYFTRLRTFLLDSSEFKNLYQPLRVHYIINGTIQSSLINCYAKPKGLKDLNWGDGTFLTFPPKSHFNFSSIKSLPEFEYLVGHSFSTKDTVILIFWTNFLRSRSVSLIDQVVSNNKTNLDNIYLINQDALYIED